MNRVNRRNRHRTRMTIRIKKKCNLADSLKNRDSKGKGQEKQCIEVRWGNKTRAKRKIMIIQVTDMRSVKKHMMKESHQMVTLT